MYRLIIAALAIAILIGGWYALVTRGPAEAPLPEALMSASFSCTDGSSFVAEFTEGDMLRVLVAGELVRTLPRVEGDGQRFENEEYLYVFAGEEASVTDKGTGIETTCTQPLDQNNAPANFGDRGEGAGEAQDASAAVSANIVGTWRSDEDPKFVRVFAADGTTEDRYDGEKVATGAWTAALGANIDVEALPIESDAVYVRIADGEELLNFKVAALTPERLELIYLGRGNTLTFTRVP